MGCEDELRAALATPGPPLALWWRDDDAGRDDPRLARLLALAGNRSAPVALAVVPGWLEPVCVQRILGSPWASVLQHGIAHRNHARAGERKIELGGGADPIDLCEGLRAGSTILRDAFGPTFLPVLVPPWNRIAPELLPLLPEVGFAALSTFAAGHPPGPAPDGLRRIDAHLDLIAWREGKRPLELDEAAARLAGLVRRHRGEAIGILSHHLVMNDAAFATLDRLLAVLQDAPGPGLLGSRTLLEEA